MTAMTCGEGIEELQAAPVDVVVLDVMLPTWTASSACREMQRQFPAVAVILLTGHASMEAGLESLECGASDYCLKPVEFDELRRPNRDRLQGPDLLNP